MAALTTLLLPIAGAQAAPTLVLDDHLGSRNLLPYTDLLASPAAPLQTDHSRLASGELGHRFRPTEGSELHTTPGQPSWIRFTLYNAAQQHRSYYLEVSPASLDGIALFHPDAAEAIPEMAGQSLMRRHRLFTLNLPPGESRTYYLQIHNELRQPIALELSDTASLVSRVGRQEVFGAVFIGMLLVVIIFTTARTILFRDTLFLILSACSVLVILYHNFAWGYLGEPQGLLPPWQNAHMVVLALLVIVCELLYGLLFPVYPEDSARLWRKILQGLLALTALATVVALIGTSQWANTLLIWLFPVITLALGIAALHCYLVTFSRKILVYLLTRGSIALVYLIGLLTYRADMIDTQDIAFAMMVSACLALLIHTTLVLTRHRQRQRQHTAQTQRIAVLGEINRAKTDIVSRVTHDIRTPMSAMLGASELLQETQLSAAQQDYVRTLQRASQELLQLLEEAAQSSRFNEDDVALRYQVINLSELLAETVSGFRNLAAERNLDLICDIDPAAPEKVVGDASRIKQLLEHVLNGAFEHCESSHILLRVRATQSQQIDFEISHRGRSYSQQEKNALNQNASLADSRIHPRFAIIGQLVALMGGTVSLRSDGQRSNLLAFSLRLGQPGPTTSTEAQLTEFQGKRLLVVDNNLTFCEVISKQCSHWGMEVFTAQTDQTALALMRNQQLLAAPVNLVLLDYHTTGSELGFAQRLSEEFSGENPPTILLLAHANIALEKTQLKASGIARILTKPLSGNALRNALAVELRYHANHQQRRHNPQQKHSLRCLVAEDNPTNAQVLTRMLDKLGIEVQLVQNGQQAVSAFMRGHFDLVFMDVEMPVMDGVEATQQIRAYEQQAGARHTPIFGLTANALGEQREVYLKAGMDLHLIKPIRLWELSETIKRWTGFEPDPG